MRPKNPKNEQALGKKFGEHITKKRGFHWVMTSFAKDSGE